MIVGVDFSTYDACLVGLPLEPADGEQPIVETVVFRKKHRSGDDAAIEALKNVRTMLLSSQLLWRAKMAFVERGFGASRRADFIMGAFFGVILTTLSTNVPAANVMTGAEWKREVSAACGVRTKTGRKGNGNLSKEEAHGYVHEVAYNYGHDIIGYGPDALDAYAISLVGRWLNARQKVLR